MLESCVNRTGGWENAPDLETDLAEGYIGLGQRRLLELKDRRKDYCGGSVGRSVRVATGVARLFVLRRAIFLVGFRRGRASILTCVTPSFAIPIFWAAARDRSISALSQRDHGQLILIEGVSTRGSLSRQTLPDDCIDPRSHASAWLLG
jgi:hypothetical protein